MTKHLVVVAGNIGVGKTSLTERMGDRLGWLLTIPIFQNSMMTCKSGLFIYRSSFWGIVPSNILKPPMILAL